MGKILETTYHDTVRDITSFYGTLLNNSFYEINDKRPTIVTYYNINKDYSSLDPGAKIAYDNIGDQTPIRFNRIKDFILYGINRVELQSDIDEFGLEADKITGDAFILPCTIIPTEGDYFEIEHITDSTWLFIVTDVQQDTLKNGSNAYKIQYRLEYVDNEGIQNAVVEDMKLIEEREGTNIIKVVRSEDYDVAKKLDDAAVMLKGYFNELYYNPKVQTFIYVDLTEWRMYDAYMIEFLIRNKILANGKDSYIHVCHQLETPKTFSMDYDKTIFRAFELKDINRLRNARRNIVAKDIISYGTTFYARYESYFQAVYMNYTTGYTGIAIEDDLFYRILEGNLVDEIEYNDLNDPAPIWENIIIRHFKDIDEHKVTITEEELESLRNINYDDSMKFFYLLPLLILCLENAIEKALN